MNRFINAGAILNNSPKDLFICPPNSFAVVHTLFISTTSVDESAHVNVQVYDASEGVIYNLGWQLEVLPNATLSFDKPINLDANDIIKLTSDKIDEVHAFASILHVIPTSL